MNNIQGDLTDISAKTLLFCTVSMIQRQREQRKKDEWECFQADNSLISKYHFWYQKWVFFGVIYPMFRLKYCLLISFNATEAAWVAGQGWVWLLPSRKPTHQWIPMLIMKTNSFQGDVTDVSATTLLVNRVSMIPRQCKKDEWDRFRVDNPLISTYYFWYRKSVIFGLI